MFSAFETDNEFGWTGTATWSAKPITYPSTNTHGTGMCRNGSLGGVRAGPRRIAAMASQSTYWQFRRSTKGAVARWTLQPQSDTNKPSCRSGLHRPTARDEGGFLFTGRASFQSRISAPTTISETTEREGYIDGHVWPRRHAVAQRNSEGCRRYRTLGRAGVPGLDDQGHGEGTHPQRTTGGQDPLDQPDGWHPGQVR